MSKTTPGTNTAHYGKRKAPNRARRPAAVKPGGSVTNNKKSLEKAAKAGQPKDKEVNALLDALRAAGQPRQ